MNIREILEVVNSSLSGDTRSSPASYTSAFLLDALSSFDANPVSATRAIRRLQNDDPPGFVVAALQRLISDRESPATQFLASVVFTDELLIEPLLDASMLNLNAAIALATNVCSVIPLLDVKLVKRVIAGRRWCDEHTVLRVLAILNVISNCHRVLPFLNQLLRHPSRRVRSKVARLIGLAHQSPATPRRLFASTEAADDPRLRANSIEELEPTEQNLELLWEAASDKHHRVATTALASLARGGDARAVERLLEMATDSRPLFRAAVAWALGQFSESRVLEQLRLLARDPEPTVRNMAIRSLVKVRRGSSPLPGDAPVESGPAPDGDSTTESDAVATAAPVAESGGGPPQGGDTAH